MINTLFQVLERELEWEKDLFLFLNKSHSVFGDYFFWFCSNSRLEACIYTSCFFLLLYRRKKQKRNEVLLNETLLIICSIILVFLLSNSVSSDFFKPVFHRLRPSHHPFFKNQVRVLFGYKGGLYGFISGHTANAFGFATISSLIFRNHLCRNIMILFACMVGYSRIYLGVHFISDVVGGAFMGTLVGIFMYWLYCICRIRFLKLNTQDYN